jgi:2-oxoglutarate dehydrogenase E1 component
MLKRVSVLQSLIRHNLPRSFSDSFLSGTNAYYAEMMYSKWIEDPKSIHASWDSYFRGLQAGIPSNQSFVLPADLVNSQISFGIHASNTHSSQNELIHKISKLIDHYRAKGHFLADTDPLKLTFGVPTNPEDLTCLTLEENGITEKDFNTKLDLSSIGVFRSSSSKNEWTPLEVINRLKEVYCGKITYQYNHISSEKTRQWIQERVEKNPTFSFDKTKKLDLFERILESQAFSLYCEKKYSTYKRFGCDGIDSGISALNHLVQEAEKYGVKESIFGMAHRGRLNVLCSVLKKPYDQIFAEFEDINYLNERDLIYRFSGDVKYHIGCSNKLQFKNGSEMILNLLPNPSHLEAVYPVVLGSALARQTKLSDPEGQMVLPIVIHGDAALAGQGIIYETQQMEKLKNYSVGGTIHLVFNNQIGFTTDQNQGRSGVYPTNIAIINQTFVIHVNAHEPESVDYAMELALEYRMAFKSDVYVNLVGFRKYGHNEQDTPTFTQPSMYSLISKMEPMYISYANRLVAEGVIKPEFLNERLQHYMSILEAQHLIARTENFKAEEWDAYGWKAIFNLEKNQTGVDRQILKDIGTAITVLPENLHAHKSIKKIYEDRHKSIVDGKNIDWATAESLAFATLINEGHSIRVSGEDVERGTFSHRHAVISDQKTNAKFTPLKQIVKQDSLGQFTITNSLLSEYAVLGFEYGHSITLPNDLTIWEAQFGDFANGAQIMIDQFITSGEKKWGKMTGLCMFLPHGSDGQGPEHSNCRLERLLSSMADDYSDFNPDALKDVNLIKNSNMIVCNITNPANFFHVLRRQLKSNFRKPLILLSPKRLLRHKLVRSSEEEFLTPSEFTKVYDESFLQNKSQISKVLICSGQIYFDLLEKREHEKIENVAIVRLEQLGPFPYAAFNKVISTYNKDVQVSFVSEEPKNFGAWDYVKPRIDTVLGHNKIAAVHFVGRPISCAPASGSSSKHKAELQKLLNDAFK